MEISASQKKVRAVERDVEIDSLLIKSRLRSLGQFFGWLSDLLFWLVFWPELQPMFFVNARISATIEVVCKESLQRRPRQALLSQAASGFSRDSAL
jgi:hypothetical protein